MKRRSFLGGLFAALASWRGSKVAAAPSVSVPPYVCPCCGGRWNGGRTDLVMAPAPDQATLFLSIKGNWSVHYRQESSWSPGMPHRFYSNGCGQVLQGCWWHWFTWERQGDAIIADYGDKSIRFSLAREGNRLEGTATGLHDGKVTFLPQPVRFTKE